MATTKTIRLTSGQAEWLAAEAERARVSENRIMQELIDVAVRWSWQFGVAAPAPADER